ncbi:MAG: TnpV protein [Clostridiales bacterium]|nr:TnpV protein [Clostridiales bacterium]
MKDEFIARVGVWGQRHYNYLKKKSPTVINVMRMKGTLEQYLIDMNRDTQETYDLLIRQYAEKESITDDLKTADNLEWTRRMNSIRNRAEEFVLHDFVFT